MLHNETGHELQFAPIKQNSELFDSNGQAKSSSTMETGGYLSLEYKLSVHSRLSIGSGDSPDLSDSLS